MIIKSSTTLSDDYGSISSLAHEIDEPIYITKDGEGDLIVMSIEAFERREQLMALKARLSLSEQSLRTGDPTVPLSVARSRLEEKYDPKS